MKSRKLKRRAFLGSAASAAVGCMTLPMFVPASVLAQDGSVAPSNRITVACIGTGPQGMAVMGGFLAHKDARVVAVCDVKDEQLEQACARVNKHYDSDECKTYKDFREILARPDIDACLIATPDHWHVPIAVAALRAGKHIYLEKPIGCSVAEAQILRRTVHASGRVFQLGTQQRSDRKFRTACEIARNSLLGNLKTIYVWAPGSTPGGSTKIVPVPPTLDYDRWLGPAPAKPYAENRCDSDGGTKTWWFDSDFALGFIAGWGIHPIDIAVWGADNLMKGIVEIAGSANYPTTGACNTATTWDIEMHFASGLQLIFAGSPNGGNASKPTGEPWPHETEWRAKFGEITTHGTVFEGSNGWVRVQRGDIAASSEDLMEAERKIRLPVSGDHVGNFLEAIVKNDSAISDVDHSVLSDTLCHIADIAGRLRRTLRFDLSTERFVDDDAANHRLGLREMRAPWKLT